MDDDVVKTCVSFKIEKQINNFYEIYSECKACNIERVLKRYYNIKYEILQQRRDRHACF